MTTGWWRGRRASADTVAADGAAPQEFLVSLAEHGCRWRLDRLDDLTSEAQLDWAQADLVARVKLAFLEGRAIRVGAQRWTPDPARQPDQLGEIEDVIVDSGYHVGVISDADDADSTGDLVIGFGGPVS